MAISDTARRNHDELFPGHVSTLAVTDPELIEVFDNFAFDEVLQPSDLEPSTRLMVQLAALIAIGALGEYRRMLGAALTAGVTPVEVKEIVYQAIPYVGIGRVYDFLHATNELLTARGIELPLAPQTTSTPETRYERGVEVREQIVRAGSVERSLQTAPADQRHIQQLLTANCFGDHVSRGGIDIQTRELLTFAMLISFGGCEPQVAGHVAGNRNVGNDRAVLIDVTTQLLPFIGYPRTLNALRVIEEANPT